MSGSPARPLSAKLGLKPGYRVALVHAPAGYEDRLLAEVPGVVILGLRARQLDLIEVFCRDRDQLVSVLPQARQALKPGGCLWISWPKKSSRLHLDLDEGQVRELGLAAGLVDVKIAAIDADWSGLKFVFRLRDRPQPG